MGRDIWRFTLPPYEMDVYQRETDLCLTGNYVYDANDPLLAPNNLKTGGTYTYGRAPDAVADIAGAGKPISFTSGHLTNRVAAFETRNRRGSRPRDPKELAKITAQWIVGWKKPDPITITFDFKTNQALTFCRMVYSGAMPMLSVKGSQNGKQWVPLTVMLEQVAGEDVKDIRFALKPAKPAAFRYVRFDFGKRKAEDVFELCEVDIWGPVTK